MLTKTLLLSWFTVTVFPFQLIRPRPGSHLHSMCCILTPWALSICKGLKV